MSNVISSSFLLLRFLNECSSVYGYLQLFQTCWFYKIKRKRIMKMKICKPDGMNLLCMAEFWSGYNYLVMV